MCNMLVPKCDINIISEGPMHFHIWVSAMYAEAYLHVSSYLATTVSITLQLRKAAVYGTRLGVQVICNYI